MTSVPKPLKFLRPHYNTMKDLFEKWPNKENKVHLNDFLPTSLQIMYDIDR